MNRFSVTFSSDTSFELQVKAIKAIASGGYDQDGSTFTFNAKWGTTRRDLNTMEAKMESIAGRGSVESIEVV